MRPIPCEHNLRGCSDCRIERKRARSRERTRAWREAYPEEARARDRAWVAAHPERKQELNRRWQDKHPEIMRGYQGMIFPAGVTILRLLELQGHRCALCRKTKVSVRSPVDHDHTTGLVRGVLCTRCNTKLQDDRAILARIPSYLDNPPAQQLLAQAREPEQLSFDFSY